MLLESFIKTIKTPVKINFTLYFLFAAVLFTLINNFNPNTLVLGLLYVFVYLHELGHVFVANYYNVKCEKIHLSILGGAAILTEELKSDMQNIKMCFAGPAVNIALAIIFALSLHITNMLGFEKDSFIVLFLMRCMYFNIAITLFNLIPVVPLDGGNILKSFINMKSTNINKAANILKVSNIASSFIFMIISWKLEFYVSSALLAIAFLYSMFFDFKNILPSRIKE